MRFVDKQFAVKIIKNIESLYQEFVCSKAMPNSLIINERMLALVKGEYPEYFGTDTMSMNGCMFEVIPTEKEIISLGVCYTLDLCEYID